MIVFGLKSCIEHQFNNTFDHIFEKCHYNMQNIKQVLKLLILTGGRLTKIHLIEIVFYHLIKILKITWPNF
jgi:hypothetical protein